MLSLKNIVKTYAVGDMQVRALGGVSIDFREHEFVSILGPSGCGKTTLLNVIGGLDRYDSGDLVIRGRSTKEYRPADWDTYRNHSVGFVFQSYNLIAHQSVLANVELALTLSGVSREERRRRAAEALGKVGLGDQLHKKPNQMSGGQMQRVAIARALVNDPDILLADEPTGALDSATSVQIMELLREVAKEKLVIMVTHNPELAETYSTRIIRLRDGMLQGDTDPYTAPEKRTDEKQSKKNKRSMSFFTALSLSFHNLLTKKTRTILVSFAGSIGIIGIALILALSHGVNLYIANIQEETLTSYPITLTAETTSLAALMTAAASVSGGLTVSAEHENEPRTIYANSSISGLLSAFDGGRNDLASFNTYLEAHLDEFRDDITAIQYYYDMDLQVYHNSENYGLVRVSPSSLFDELPSNYSSYTYGFSVMSEIMPGKNGELINETVRAQYEVLEGRWPERADELVLIVDRNNTVTNLTLYALGLADPAELTAILIAMFSGESVEATVTGLSFSYDDFLGEDGIRLNLVYNSDFFTPTAGTYQVGDTSYPVYEDLRETDSFDPAELFADGMELKFVGIICPAAGAVASSMQGSIAYTSALTQAVMAHIDESDVARQQLATPTHDVFTGLPFTVADADQLSDAEKKEKLQTYFASLTPAQQADMYLKIRTAISEAEMQAILEAIYETVPAEDRRAFLTDVYAFNSGHGSLARGTNTNRIVATIAHTVTPTRTLEEYEEMVAMLSQAFGLDGTELTPGTEEYEKYAGLVNALYPTEAKLDRAFESVVRTFTPTVRNAVELQDMATEIFQKELARINGENDTADEQRAYLKAFYRAAGGLPDALIDSYVDDLSYTDLFTEFHSAAMRAVSQRLQDETVMVPLRAELFHDYLAGLSDAEYAALYVDYMEKSESTLEDNLSLLGTSRGRDPLTSIQIYPADFAAKERLTALIDRYNAQADEEHQIEYTDLVGIIMSSVTTIVNVISYVLIAFVSISLVVSSIMIGIITYISVLERTKEIGILRAIGASKRDISRVFNAETLVIGFAAGVMGIALTLLFCIPVNLIVHAASGIQAINAVLPVGGAFALVGISMLLTLVAGLIPSGIAAKKDPVEALRTE